MYEKWKSRTELLLGERAVAGFAGKNIFVAGVGGVGGVAVEMLVRAGIGNVTIVDGDVYDESNLNRQIHGFYDNIGQVKVDVVSDYMRRINPLVNINPVNRFCGPGEWADLLGAKKYDFVVDAVDTVAPKTGLILYCYENNIPLISVMGAGGRMNPQKVSVSDISKSYQCSLAREIRSRLRKMGIKKGVPVVFSSEEVDRKSILPVSGQMNKKSTVGTVSYMTAIFGCFAAYFVIDKLRKEML